MGRKKKNTLSKWEFHTISWMKWCAELMFVQLYSSLSPNHCLWLCDYVFDTVNALNAC